jgi:sugar/nucleoside kinase (ribokinase family)
MSDAQGDAWLPAEPAPVVVDTTGAGDAFVGTLAGRLALDDSLADATRVAIRAASESVTWRGARPTS